MKLATAFWAGVLGGIAALIIAGIARLGGIELNYLLILGTLWGGRPDVLHGLLGLVLFLALFGCIGIVYGAAFEFVTHRASAVIGVVFSILHTIGAGLFLYALPTIHPLIPETLTDPGPFMSTHGFAGIMSFVAGHIAFGWIVGYSYGRAVHRLPPDEILL